MHTKKLASRESLTNSRSFLKQLLLKSTVPLCYTVWEVFGKKWNESSGVIALVPFPLSKCYRQLGC